MAAKLTWDEIKQRYDGEWIELVNYDWPECTPLPKSGIVRVHAPNRKAFYELANQDPPEDSAILFVGKINLTHGVVANNIYKITVCE